ncbi:MAG TPA: LysR family transcriptional regulator [Steroidobacteraceae bacterium]|nr:LysR family transcriptional regulator [Steroidobacteraceae bacterium]
MSNVTLTDAKLHYLAEAAALGSMRAASEKLDVAVSSISRQIAQLEADVGMPLIERGRRTIKLTEAGEIALRYYRESVAQREAFCSSLQGLRGMHSGQVCLATGEGFVGLLSTQLQTFLARHVGLRVSVNIAGTLEAVRQVSEDEAHIGFVFHAPADPRITVRSYLAQPIELLVHPAHPLAGAESVTLRELDQHRLCLPEVSFRIRQMIGMAEAQERVSLNPHISSNSLTLLKHMVKFGGYATLLPETAALIELNRRELVAVPVANSVLKSTALNLICRLGRTLPTAPTAFLRMMEDGMRAWERKTRAGA